MLKENSYSPLEGGTSHPSSQVEEQNLSSHHEDQCEDGKKQVSVEHGEFVSGIAIQDWGSLDEVEGRILKSWEPSNL